jgi:hypothetical protein
MAGYEAVLEIRRLERDLDAMGLMLSSPKHGGWSGDEYSDRAGVRPKDATSLPIYSRDAELFTGTLAQIRVWLIGIQWARDYDMMLKLSDEKKRAKKEDECRHAQMVRDLKRNYTEENKEQVK